MQGRNLKGSIYVFGGGNGGGVKKDTCSTDGWLNSIYTIAVGAAGIDGMPAPYDEQCASKLVSAFVEGGYNVNRVVCCIVIKH